MAALYREVVLKEKPVQSENGFISLDALVKPKREWQRSLHSGNEAGIGRAGRGRLSSVGRAPSPASC